MYRFLIIGVTFLWLSAMAALFVRDVWPAWTAQDSPPLIARQFTDPDRRHEQFAILDNAGKRIGTAWGNIAPAPAGSTLYGTVVFAALPLVPEVRVETETEFDTDGGLDSFSLNVHGLPMRTIRVRGERRGIYFPCELQIGSLHRQANLDLSASRMISESLRPFSFLPSLRVGQSWRMQVLDPLSAIVSRKAEFSPIIARVTARETIHSPLFGDPVDCFVVETLPPQIKAWVGPDGRVLVQQVDVPGFGKMTVRQEPFDESERKAAVHRIPMGSGWSSQQE